jgi:hypothetical protein
MPLDSLAKASMPLLPEVAVVFSSVAMNRERVARFARFAKGQNE